MMPAIFRESFVLKNSSGERIACDLRQLKEGGRKPVVVICHSFMAFKDWGWFPFVATELAKGGFATIVFNFSRNGVSDNPDRITDFDAFQRNTISHELSDLSAVIHAVLDGKVGKGSVHRDQIVLLGHSRGGGLAIITAVQSPCVKALVTWSSVSTFDRWTRHQKVEWRKLGYLPLARDTAASPLRLGLALLEDVENNRKKLDIVKAAAGIHVPWLIIHGTEDLTVRISEGEQLHAPADKTMTEIVPLEKVGHQFDGPEVKEGSAIRGVVDVTVRWLSSIFF